MNMGVVQDIMDILQQGYDMSSASPLDRVVATRILDYLGRTGWMNHSEVAHLVLAAGGEIQVSYKQLEAENPLLTQWQDPENDKVVFKVREPKE